MDAHAVQVDEQGKRLDALLEELANNGGGGSSEKTVERIEVNEIQGGKQIKIWYTDEDNTVFFVYDPPKVVQKTGGSAEAVMSQKACSTAFASALKDFAEGSDVLLEDISETPHSVAVTFWHKNLFNKATVLENAGLNVNQTGATYSSTGKCVSDYIKVEEGKTYHLNWGDKRRYVVGYDSNKQYVSKLFGQEEWNTANDCFTVPVGMAYARLECFIESLDTLQLELGDASTKYAPFTDAEEITVKTENGSGVVMETKTIHKDETIEFNSVYPVMRIYTPNVGNFKAKYNVDTSSIFANEGDAWED